MRKLLLYTITVISILTTCNKDAGPKPDNPYGLPNATQTGAEVFACRIDGANAIAKSYDPYHMGGGVKNDTLGVWGDAIVGRFFDMIELGINKTPTVNTTYTLSDSTDVYCLFGTDSTCQLVGGVTNIYPKNGTITLTRFDTANKIISGIFAFDVPIPGGCDTVHVTYGRFDYGY